MGIMVCFLLWVPQLPKLWELWYVPYYVSLSSLKLWESWSIPYYGVLQDLYHQP